MRKLFYIVFLSTSLVYAQNFQQEIASLKQKLKSSSSIEKTTQLYSDLTWNYIDVSLDSALVYGNKALIFAQKTKKPTLIAQCYSNLGGVYLRKEDFKKSEEAYKKTIQIRQTTKDFEGIAKAKINLGNVYASKQNYIPATKYFIEAIAYFENKNDTIASLTKGNLGLIFMEMKNYSKAIKYLEESTFFLKKSNMKQGLCHTYLSLGDASIDQKDTLKALKYYTESLKNCKDCRDNLGISTLNQRLGDLHNAQGNSANAAQCFAIADKLFKELNSEVEKSNSQLSKSQELINKKQYDEAKKMLLQIKKVHQEYGSDRYLVETYKKLTWIYLHQNNRDSTAYYFNKYTILKDEKLKATVLKQTSELETKYQTVQKEKLLLKKEAENKAKTNTIAGLSLLAIFITIISALLYRQQTLKNTQQKQEFHLKEAIAHIETQNKLQEQRLAISRDLHDNIGSQLTFIISSVENLKFGFPNIDSAIKNHLTKISDFTKTTMVELRDTIWAMNSQEISFDDLSARIYNFIEKAQSVKQNIVFKLDISTELKQTKLSSLQGINLYRTIQEATNNAIKYAQANHINITIGSVQEKLVIHITDDGLGFDIEQANLGNGLLNMKKRIEEIQGDISIKSQLNKGTQIEINLPK